MNSTKIQTHKKGAATIGLAGLVKLHRNSRCRFYSWRRPAAMLRRRKRSSPCQQNLSHFLLILQTGMSVWQSLMQKRFCKRNSEHNGRLEDAQADIEWLKKILHFTKMQRCTQLGLLHCRVSRLARWAKDGARRGTTDKKSEKRISSRNASLSAVGMTSSSRRRMTVLGSSQGKSQATSQ